MLGITFHNPATISVFLDRMRFKDCFVMASDVKSGDWKRKVTAFTSLPSDGRERVLFVETFAALQSLLSQGAAIDTVKVAVYDDCNVLATVPAITIVDAHVNASTWQLYNVSFAEFNDALAAQPVGVPALVAKHTVREDADLPVPATVKRTTRPRRDDDDVEVSEPTSEKSRSLLIMEQILDDIEAPDEDEEDEEEAPADVPIETDERIEPSVMAMPQIDRAPMQDEIEEEPEPEPPVIAKPIPKLEPPKAKKTKPDTKAKKPKLASYELF